MPRLTQIKETKKGRLALFLDGEFAFSLDEDTFAAAALHQDDELEDWQIEELRKKSETRRALDKAMDYLSLRDHAAGELLKPFIPYGKITIIQGDPGEGKTTLVLQIIAALTTGRPIWDGLPEMEPIHVIYQTAEDGVGDTIRPRQ